MFKVIDLLPEGKLEETAGGDDRVTRPPTGVRRWVDLLAPTPAELALLRDRFDFHPLALEDCATFQARSKLEEYRDHLFIVVHSFTAPPDDPDGLLVHEIHAFVGDSFLVTVHDEALPAIDQVWREGADDPTLLGRGPGWVFYRTAATLVGAIVPVLEGLTCRVEAIEADVLDSPERHDLREVFALRSRFVSARRVLRPLRDVVQILSRRHETPFDRRSALYLRDLHDHVLRALEGIEESEGLVANTVDAYRYELSNRSNAIMAKLTIFSAIFLPLGFITGFFGQNFAHLPFDSDTMLVAMLTSIVAVPVVLLWWFARKGWL